MNARRDLDERSAWGREAGSLCLDFAMFTATSLLVAVRFAGFSIDFENRLLLRGRDVVAVQPKVFACLALLVRHPGQLITTQRLRAELWPAVRVEPESVRRIIREARRAIGDAGREQRLIQTRARLGIVFVGEVSMDPAPTSASVETPWTFVGRGAELASLKQTVSAVHTRGSVRYVSGEAGVGKTAVLSRLRVEAQLGSALWLSGRCYANQGAPAFWPWHGIFESLQALYSFSNEERRAVSRILPELAAGSATDGRPVHPADGDAEARFVACAGVTRILERISRSRPLVVVLEDLHWADDGTLLLLELLGETTRTRRVVLIASYREDQVLTHDVLAGLVARTRGREGCASITLRGLAIPELRALLEANGHPAPTLHSAEALHRLTGGNPLLIRELMGASGGTWAEWRLDTPHPGQWTASIRHMVGERVRLLPQAARASLTKGAILGNEFSLERLARLEECGEERLEKNLLPALRAGLLSALLDDPRPSNAIRRFRFSHALYKDALYEDCPLDERRRLHARAFSTWKSDPESSERTMALASHAVLAGENVEQRETQALCEAAGKEALAALAFDLAAQHFERAVEYLDGHAHAAHAAHLTLLLARARWEADEPHEEVARTYARAATHSRRAGLPTLFAKAALGAAVGEESIVTLGTARWRPWTATLLDEALEQLDATDVAMRRRVARALCWVRAANGDRSRARRAARQSLELTSADLDGSERCLSIWLRCMDAVMEYDIPRVRAGLEVLTLEPRNADLEPWRRVEACMQVMAVCFAIGDAAHYDSATHELTLLLSQLLPAPAFGRAGQRMMRYRMIPWIARATRATMRGEFRAAEQLYFALGQESERLGIRRSPDDGYSVFLMMAQLFGYQGRAAVLLPMLEQAIKERPDDRWYLSVAAAQLALERGVPEEATQHYENLRATGFQDPYSGEPTPAKLETRARMADLCGVLGTAADARLLYDALFGARELCGGEGLAICHGALARPLGELARQMGDRELSVSHLERALQINERLGHRPEIARTQVGLGRVLLELNRHGEARERLAEGRTESAAMGMVPLCALAARLEAGVIKA
jgi:DNA-binding winged helix-turn-helix (wHTH) protein/tetratricopeptide (TPR) repeat protein